mgnify:FL=1|jgi:lipoprotein
MKKFITLMLVFLLAFGCVAGCGEDEVQKETDGNNTTKALTITDVTNTIAKMSEGAKFDFTFILNVKPIFDENSFSKEDFEKACGSFVETKADGSYDFSFKIMGEGSKDGKYTILLKDQLITECVQKDGKIYINAKSIFNIYVELIKAVMGDSMDSAYAEFLKWPYENEYIDITQYSEKLSEILEGSVSEPGVGMVQLDAEELQAIITAIQKNVPMDKVLEFLNKMETVTTAANVLKADNEKIEFKFDKTNAKAFLIGCSNLFRTDLADLTDAVAASLKDAEGIPEELKELLSGFNKEEFQQKLNEELTEESVQAEAEELEQEIGDGHFYLTIGATDTSCPFKMDLFISELETQDTSASISQMGFVFEVKVENQKIGEITAPENILTEEELNALLTLFGIYDDGSDPNGDPSDYESF